MKSIIWSVEVVIFLIILNVLKLKCGTLEPCFDVASKRLKKEPEKWFKSGQVYSYCMEKYTTFDGTSCQGCSSTKYIDCVSVCSITSARKGSIKCEEHCKTDECKAGCEFYNYVFNKEGNFSLDESKIARSNSTIIHESQHADNVTFTWAPVVVEDHKKIPSVYLITIREFNEDEFEYVLRLTNDTTHTATMDDMCNHIYGEERKYDVPSLKFAIKVYPINLNGPSNLKEFLTKKLVMTSKYTRPSMVKPIQNISVAYKSPYFQIKEGKSNIVWKLNWSKSSVDSRSIGVRYKRGIDSCENSERTGEMMQLNLGMNEFQDGSLSGDFDVGVINTKDDHLDGCQIKVDVVLKYGKCFVSDVASKIISYKGCSTVRDYGNPCQQLKTTEMAPLQTNLKNISLSTFNHSCKKNDFESRTCPDDYKSRCRYCLKPHYHVMVRWDSKEIPYVIRSFILRWGDASDIFLTDTSQVNLMGNATFYVIKISPRDNQPKKLGVQLHAITDHSDESWKWDAPIIKMDLKLYKEDSREILPVGISTRTLIVAAILTTAVVIVFAMIMWKFYKRHMLKQKDDTSVLSDKVFMTPESAIITDEWEINPTSIKLIEEIGEGAFGKVYCATVNTSALVKSRFAKQCAGVTLLSDKTKTAVKLLKPGVQDEEINDFQDEISLMKTIGYHKNIVNIIGCSTVKQPLCLVLEFMHNGDLLNYLREERNKRVNSSASDASFEQSITSDVMISFTWQISKGMEYLASRNVVHRDLAARNILVGHNNLVKISDFGLSKNLSNEPIYLSINTTRKLPLKWMSVEAIFHKEFTTSSDVWSYGVVLFEIVTLGGAPYPFIGHRELCKLLKSGYRMEKPDNCSEEMYDIMCHCWNAIPAQRPTFVELREHFESMMEKSDHYFSFEIDDTKAYYNVASFKSIPSDDEEEDVLPQDYDHQNTVKPLEYVKAVDVPVDIDYENKPTSAELVIGSENSRYISPQSLKPVTDKERTASFDNPNFHFNE